MKTLKPRRLRRGDLIGLVSPASPIADPSRIERGVRYLEGLGYRTLVGKSVTASHAYLAGTDDERVADLHAMFTHPKVKAIMCIRGGYGTPRLLPLLDYGLIRQNPKILVGYSDITALHLALWRRTRLITFHGPMVGVDLADPMDPLTEGMFWDLLTSQKKLGKIALPEKSGRSLSDGRASGHLLGGNLALVVTVLGTGFQPDFRGSVLFIEDITEEPYRIDRMLSHLRNAAVLKKCSGILSGQFTDCVPQDTTKPSFTVDEILEEAADQARKPFLAGLPFGHENPKLTLPVGARIRFDAGLGTIEFMEAAVR